MRNILVIVLLGIAKELNATNIEVISQPQRNPSTGIIIHKRSDMFIDIEAPVERVRVACTLLTPDPENPKKRNAFLGIYIADEEILYDLFYRRPIDSSDCFDEKKEYEQMIKNAKTVHVVATEIRLKENPVKKEERQVPTKFRGKPQAVMGYFSRLQAGGKCKSYFISDCDLPKNYWSGMFPIK
jgi:hypothetical protein